MCYESLLADFSGEEQNGHQAAFIWFEVIVELMYMKASKPCVLILYT